MYIRDNYIQNTYDEINDIVMVQEDELVNDDKINLKRKNNNNDNFDVKANKFIFNYDEITNVQTVGDEINVTRTNDDVEIIDIKELPNILGYAFKNSDIEITKVQPSHPR